MKKALTYILIVLLMSDHASLGQCFKITFLVQHYCEHRQQDNSLSLMGFLEMHYWGQDLPDHDDEKDNQLPFKKAGTNFHYIVFNHVKQVDISLPRFYSSPITYGLPETDNLPEGYLHTLLKPPKIHTLA